MKKITIIGIGSMGSAVYNKLKESDIFNVVGCDRKSDINKEVADADVIIIAVKPQQAEELFQNINVDLSDKLVVSIMTGISIEKIKTLSSAKKIIRSMPNLGIQVGKGVVGWVASEHVDDEEKRLVQKIFFSMGLEIELDDENKMDALTAISGSGPAYFFYLAELLKEKAVEFGFEKDVAKSIARETLIGSAELLKNDNKSTKEWREAVTSKGGTTEAALDHMMENNFDKIFLEALGKAKNRAEELS